MLGHKLLTTQPVRICTPFDPAIDRQASNVNLYTVSRDESLIHAKPGEGVTWFHIRRLPRSVAGDIESTSASRMVAQLLAFQLGVIHVENLHQDSGDVLSAWTPLAFQTSGGRDPRQGMTREEIDQFPVSERIDIGDVILRRADLRRGRQPFFPPPESSVRACGEARFLSADESPVAASLLRGTPDSAPTTEPKPEPASEDTSG